MAKIGYYKTSFKNSQTGLKMYTVRLAPYSMIDDASVVDYAVSDSSINAKDVAQGCAALAQAIGDFVLNGHSITLEGLGNFRTTCQTGKWNSTSNKWGSAGASAMDGVSSEDIKNLYVRFRPCASLRDEINSASFFKVDNLSSLFGKSKGGKLVFE